MAQECDAHIAGEMAKLVQEAAVDAVTFLGQMLHVWGDHCSQMLTLRSIFLYLDRTYVISNSAVRSLFDMGLQLFRTHLQSFPEASLSPGCSSPLLNTSQYQSSRGGDRSADMILHSSGVGICPADIRSHSLCLLIPEVMVALKCTNCHSWP